MRHSWLTFTLVVALVAGSAHALRAQAIYAPPPGQNFEGVWLLQGDHSVIKTVDGKLPPMTSAAATRYAAALRARKAGKPDFDTIQTCKPHGFPRILFAAYRNFNSESLGCAAKVGGWYTSLNRRFALA